MLNTADTCVICGVLCRNFLCNRDRKRYFYFRDYDVVALKPRKKVSKRQSEIYKLCKKIFRSPCLQEVVFPFQLYLRMDVVVMDYKLCIEYDSEIHFKYTPYFHKSKREFMAMKSRDEIKTANVKNNGWNIIRIKYDEKNDDVSEKLKKYKEKYDAKRSSKKRRKR